MAKKPSITQAHFFDPRLSDDQIRLMEDEQAIVFDKLLACGVLLDKVRYCLKEIARLLPVSYSRRTPHQDIYLRRLQADIVTLGHKNKIVDRIGDAIDTFCAGGIDACDNVDALDME